MAEQGGVGIIFHASRSGRCLLVSRLLHPFLLLFVWNVLYSTYIESSAHLKLVFCAVARFQVKSLVPGGAAEKSCAVDVGHQIIAIGDKDVSSATLEEVSVMLRGPIGSDITLKFLETRQVKLNMERCVYMNDGTPSVGIKWKDGETLVPILLCSPQQLRTGVQTEFDCPCNASGSSEMIVEGMMPGYQGFGE